MKKLTFVLAAVFLGLSLVWEAEAAPPPITLQHNNSTAIIDPFSSAGMFHWDVQGQNELHQQWFWYRVDANPEAPINTISAPTIIPFGPPFVGRGVGIVYTAPQFNIETDYILTGGSVRPQGQIATADITEIITITNTSASPLHINFFQYSDFDIGGPGNDSVTLGTDPNGLYNYAQQTDPNALLTESLTGVTPSADYGEAALTPATLIKLNDGVADNLNDVTNAGPGNATWAFQWDITLDPGGTFILSKDKQLEVLIVPEPTTLALLPLGFAAFGIYRRHNRK